MRQFFNRYKWLILAVVVVGAALASNLELFSYEQLVLDLVEPKITFAILSAVSIGVSFAHTIKYRRELISDNYGVKDLLLAVSDVFQVPVALVGAYVILKLFALAKLRNYDHLQDLTNFESSSLVLVAFVIFIKSLDELYKKFKDLSIHTSEASPVEEPKVN